MTDYYVDSVNGSDSNDGLTSSSPKLTFTQVNALSGDLSDTSIYLAKGSTFREMLNFSGASVYGSAGSQLKITSYGSGDKPIITAAEVCSGFTQDLATDPQGRLYKKTGITVNQDIYYNGKSAEDKRIQKVAWDTDADTTFAAMSENTASWDATGTTIYVWLSGGVDPNDIAEITNLDNCIYIITTLGYISVTGIHATKARLHNIRIETVAANTPDRIVISGNTADYSGVDGASLAADGILVYGSTDANRITNLYLYNNYCPFNLNNAIECAFIDGAYVDNNIAHDCGGNLIEWWESCSNTITTKNSAKDMNTIGRLSTSYHKSFGWVANRGTSTNNDFIGNVGINVYVRGLHIETGDGKIHNNTLIGCANRTIDLTGNGTFNLSNNILGAGSDDTAFQFPTYISWLVTNTITSNYNIFYPQTTTYLQRWRPNNANTTSFATYKTNSSQDANSFNEDPLFTDETSDDLSLQAGSSGSGSGTKWWGTGTRPQAYNGELFDTQAPDIGGMQSAGAFYPSAL